MNPILISISLLICSNVFMTFAWYAHLKELNNKPWIIAALVSWGGVLYVPRKLSLQSVLLSNVDPLLIFWRKLKYRQQRNSL